MTLAQRLAGLELERPQLPAHGPAAVLLALSPVDGDDFALILLERPAWLRQHAGQVALPGGAFDAEDADIVATALREAHEEVGLEPSGVEVLGALPNAQTGISGYDVVPVVARWDGRAPLRPSPAEVGRILRPTLRGLADPERHGKRPLTAFVIDPDRVDTLPAGAFTPVFEVEGVVVWGFTAAVLSGFLRRLGLPAPPVPESWLVTPPALE